MKIKTIFAVPVVVISTIVAVATVGIAESGCTKQQAVNVANTGVQVAVDACQLAPQLLPPNTPAGSVVALLCPLIEGGAPTVEVLIDQVIWNAMVKTYQTSHPGFTPKVYQAP